MKTFTYSLLASMMLFATQVMASEGNKVGGSEWTLLKSQDGVSFYYVNKVSRVNGAVNTIIKVENTNDFSVDVNFTPALSCDGDNYNNEKEASVSLNPGQHSLYTYKGCESDQKPKVKLSNTSINK